ncbi:recombination protein NinG, partial [Pseudomonas aeruginosa]
MTLTASQPKPKKCQNPECGTMFVPQRLGQRACSPACALAIKDKHATPARKAIADRERREIKVRKERLKSRADHLREAQQAFNEFIRLRDADQPCISCGRHHDGQYHAGHYRTVAASPELRFEPLNVHKQCAPCNNHKSGDIVNYRI